MSTIIETYLKDVLGQINSKLDKLTDDVNQLKVSVTKDINDIKISIAEDIGEVKASITKLEEGQNGINKRLDNLDFIARTVIGGVVLALLAGLAKLLYPNLIS